MDARRVRAMSVSSPEVVSVPSRPRERVARAAPWVAAIVVALPVLAYRYPPMFDLPCHEEIVAAMRYAGDAGRYPFGLMAWNIGHANQLFYFLAWPLSYVVPVDLSCKLVIAASVACAPLAAARLADYVGATRAAAVVVAPLALGFAFTFGFVGNVLGLTLFLGLLPTIDRFARKPSTKGMIGVVAAFAALFAAHEMALAFGVLSLVTLSVAQPLRPRATVQRLAPISFSLLGLLVEHRSTLQSRGPTLAGLPSVIDLATWQKLDQIPEALLGRHGDVTTRPTFLALLAVITLLVLDRFHSRARNGGAFPSVRALLDANRFALLGLVLIVAYFVFPFSVTGAMWLHARFLAPGVAILTVAVARRNGTVPWVVQIASFVAVAAQLLLLRPEFEATSAVYRDLDPLLARIEPGSAVADVDVVGGPLRNLVFSVGGAAARAAATRGGRMAVSFTQTTPIPPVVIARERRWDGALKRMSGDGVGLRPAFDLRRFRYVLAWTFPAQVDAVERAMAPEARLVATSGGWLLFESTLPLSPLLSDEPAVGTEESVGQRLRAMTR
jgi:hypothetical protein